jgi:hypothetical protein
MTAIATFVCLLLIVAGFALFRSFVAWPTSLLGEPPEEWQIMLFDNLPVVVSGFVIGVGAMLVTRRIFPQADTKTILYTVGALHLAVAALLMMLSGAIGGGTNTRDIAAVVALVAVVVGAALVRGEEAPQ